MQPKADSKKGMTYAIPFFIFLTHFFDYRFRSSAVRASDGNGKRGVRKPRKIIYL